MFLHTKKRQAVNVDVLPRTINNSEQNCHRCTVVDIAVSQRRIQVATTDEACLGDRENPVSIQKCFTGELFEFAFQSHPRSADLKNTTLAVRVRKDHSQQHPRVRVTCLYIKCGASRKLQPDHVPSPRYAERARDRDHHEIHIQH